MKRILSSAMTIFLGLILSSCGHINEFPKNNLLNTDSIAVNEKINEKSNTSLHNNNNPKEYENVIRSYFDASNNNEYEKLQQLIYPDRIVQGILKINNIDKFYTNIYSNATEISDKNYKIIDIINERTMTAEELEQHMLYLDKISILFDKIESYGGDVETINEEQREELYNIFLGLTKTDSNETKHTYSITKGYDVTVKYSNNGEPDEDYFFVYYVDEEGWKINNTMRKYVKESKKLSANSEAKSVYVAYSTELENLENKGINLDGTYIIGSNDTFCFNVPINIDVNKIRKNVENDYNELLNYDYFVIIQDGVCMYSAICNKNKFSDIGTFPTSSIPISFANEEIKTEKISSLDLYTLNDLFNAAKDIK